MDTGISLATASRDGHLALRRVERQQDLIERLHAARGTPVPLQVLSQQLHVSIRTVARDVERLRSSGVPLLVRRGRAGGVALTVHSQSVIVELEVPEVAAIMSSLAVLGPTVSASAESVMRKLATSLAPPAVSAG